MPCPSRGRGWRRAHLVAPLHPGQARLLPSCGSSPSSPWRTPFNASSNISASPAPIARPPALLTGGDLTGTGGLPSRRPGTRFCLTPRTPAAIQNPAGASPNTPRHADHPITGRPVRRNRTGCKTALNFLSFLRYHTAPAAIQNPAGASPNTPRHADHPITGRPIRRNRTGCKTALNFLSLTQPCARLLDRLS